MKPYELIAALMAREGLGPLPLAKKMGRPKLQPQIHRFVNGDVASPARTTAEPLAAYFKIPTEAIYTEQAATAVARERDISAVLPTASARKRKPSVKASAPSPEAMKIARQYDRLTSAGKQRYRLLMLVAQDGISPTDVKPTPGRPSGKASHDPTFSADSGLGDLGDSTHTHRSHPKSDK